MNLCALALMLLSAQEPESQSESVELPLRVNHAIAHGVAWLRSEQKEDGRWAGYDDVHPGGMTALVVYTLLKSGLGSPDPAVMRAREYLAARAFSSTYSASVHLLMLEALRQPDSVRSEAQRRLDFLVESQKDGLWAYPWGEPDMSNVQFALLGLRAAHRLGLEVPSDTLERCTQALWRLHEEAGSFRYRPDMEGLASVTAATLGGLAILEELGQKLPAVQRELRKRSKDRQRSERWMAEHFDVRHNRLNLPRAWTPGWHYAYLWAVERWCGFEGRQHVGEHDWYTEGAEFLTAIQSHEGFWPAKDARALENTCFALLFLRRATVTPDEQLGQLYERLSAEKREAKPSVPKPDADLPPITSWLLAGPWSERADESLLSNPPFRPQKVKARVRNRVARKPWEVVELPTGPWANLDDLGPRPQDRCLWALATRIVYAPGGDPKNSKAAARRLRLWLTFEDGWSVWLDGRELGTERRVQSPIVEDLHYSFELEAGEHQLLILVEDLRGAAAFRARLTDDEGRALTESEFRIGANVKASDFR